VLNILWVEDEYSEPKKLKWFKDRRVEVETNFDAAEKVINSDLNKFDVVVLDINLENSEHTENIKRYADSYNVSPHDFLEKCGMNLYFILLENGFPKERIAFLTANANIATSQINDLRLAYDIGDDDNFKKILNGITSSFGDEEKKYAYQLISNPDGYDENDINSLCDYLGNHFNKLNEGEGKNTYEILCDTAKNCRMKIPKACVKGTNQLDAELESHEENNYLVLRRGVIEGCDFIKNHIDSNDDNIQFRDFIKLDKKNWPIIDISTTEIINYLDALAQSLTIRNPINGAALNIQYRLFLRMLVHEWEENIEAPSLKKKYANDLSNIRDIYTFGWIMKTARNWTSHAKLLEPLDHQIIAFLFLINMRAMFKLPKSILPYEKILFRCISDSPTNAIDSQELNNHIIDAEQNVDGIWAGLKINESGHFGKKINDIYRQNTGNLDAEDHNFKGFLLQYFWVNQKSDLRNLTTTSDNFLPTLARHIYHSSFFPEA